MVKDAVID